MILYLLIYFLAENPLLNTILDLLIEMKIKLTEIEQKISTSNTVGVTSFNINLIENFIPFNTIEDINNLEELLKSNAEAETQLVTILF